MQRVRHSPYLSIIRVHEWFSQPVQDGLKVHHKAVSRNSVFTDLQPRSFNVQVNNPCEILQDGFPRFRTCPNQGVEDLE